jgi:hypothetical protein
MSFKKLFLIVTTLVLTDALALAAEVPSYDIRAHIDPSRKLIQAQETVTFTNNSTQHLESLYFHIYPNRLYTHKEKDTLLRYAGFFKVDLFPEGYQQPDFKIEKIVAADSVLSYAVEGDDQTILKVILKENLAPGESTQVTIDFSVTIPRSYGRFAWNENVFALSRWYPILSVHKDEGWKNYPFYPFHRPFFSESAIYHVELTVPQEQTVIHSGVLTQEKSLDNQNKLLVIDSKQPIREFTLAMSAAYQYKEARLGQTTLRAYYLPGREAHAQKALESAKGLMEYYTQKFGAYPYETFSIAPVYLGYGGEQMSNMIFIDTRVFELPQILDRYFDFLIAHETGHQWFYNMVGIDEFTEIWLEEGVHSYFLLEYLENKYGADAEIVHWPSWSVPYVGWMLPRFSFRMAREARYKSIARIGLDKPVLGELSSFAEPSSIFSITYGKGSRILGMLRHVMGNAAFEKSFTRIFQEFQFKNLSVADFKRICEEESQQDLTAFFSEWLESVAYLDASVAGVRGEQIYLRNKGQATMPVDVSVEFADGSTQNLVWDGKKKEETLDVSGGKRIKRVTLDPDQKLLELDRTNNSWPRHLAIKPVPIYLGLYDIPLFLPDNSYNLIAGPYVAQGGLGGKVSFQKPFDYNFYASSVYEFSEGLHHSQLGYEFNNLFHSQTVLGFQLNNRTDHDGDEDLVSGKMFLRKELWPVQYGLSSINDHVTLYMLRNQELDKTLILGGTENNRNLSYLKKNEAIVGTTLHLERSSPYPDPRQGYRTDLTYENSGHFFGATQHFNRAEIDTSLYAPVTLKSQVGLRFKYGWGAPEERLLYQLGGMDGLRGYDRKTIRGSNVLLGSLEYRFPIKRNLNWEFFDNLLSVDSIGGVVFFDGGQAWFEDFDESTLKKDAGAGLRVTVNVGSFLEKMVLRADIAQAINEDDEDPHFWFGVNHAF